MYRVHNLGLHGVGQEFVGTAREPSEVNNLSKSIKTNLYTIYIHDFIMLNYIF